MGNSVPLNFNKIQTNVVNITLKQLQITDLANVIENACLNRVISKTVNIDRI